jgi:hypothetical protein
MNIARFLIAASFALIPVASVAQTTNPADTGSSAGCTALVQSAASGAAAEIAADNQIIQPPTSVTQLSCLGNFFNGVGLNLITNLLNPSTLLTEVEGQICSDATNLFKSATGTAECGITITGFNLGGFGTLGFGSFCPSLSIGGGGPTLGTVGVSGSTGLGVSTNALTPSGYPSVAGTTP